MPPGIERVQRVKWDASLISAMCQAWLGRARLEQLISSYLWSVRNHGLVPCVRPGVFQDGGGHVL
jgi:hypothetical protein